MTAIDSSLHLTFTLIALETEPRMFEAVQKYWPDRSGSAVNVFESLSLLKFDGILP